MLYRWVHSRIKRPPMMSSEAPATRVLIVEDEYFIADDVVRTLRNEGLETIGPVADDTAALAALRGGGIDFAVLDINLDGAISFGVASELRRRSIPFLFLTGYDPSIVPAEYGDVAVLQKPSEGVAIVAEIRRRCGDAAPVPG